ncbi:MAG: macro domain-containing protein [Anaerolineales bacterium]|jgi:O-acetyl-ADP-ribose deacetylase (regulator of RNase III)
MILRAQELPSGQRLLLVSADLTQEKVDAIVNAANAYLQHGGGVAGAIVRRGGQVVQTESDAWRRAHGPARPDHPAITGPGALPCKAIIHAVGPVWGEGDEEAKLHTAVYSALVLAEERGFSSIALPAISTGIFGFPKRRGAQVILEATLDFCRLRAVSPLREIHFTVIDRPTLEIFRDEFDTRWPSSQPAENDHLPLE